MTSHGNLGDWDESTANLLGAGGEAEVFAFGVAHALRLYRSTSEAAHESAAARFELTREIEEGARNLPFATPSVIEQGIHGGRSFHVELRLEGQALSTALETSTGDARRRLIMQYLETALLVGDVAIERESLGEIGRADAIRCSSWQDYLLERATRSLLSSPLAGLQSDTFTSPVGDLAGAPALVHLDYCPANVMTTGDNITAVIDFGYATIIGDRRMNVAAAVAHLLAPQITPSAQEADADIVDEWLHQHGIADYVGTATKWLAAYWTFAFDDTQLFEWCQSVLNS